MLLLLVFIYTMSAISSENVLDFLSLPTNKSNTGKKDSKYEKLLSRVNALDNTLTVKEQRQAILKLIDEMLPSEPLLKERISQYDNVAQLFRTEKPVCILFYGVEEDCGYSLLYLAMKFLECKSDFRIYAAYDLTKISCSDANIINSVIASSEIKQIKTYYSHQASANFLTELSEKHRFEWIIINHQDRFNDVDNVKMLESLSLVQPGIALLKINDFSIDTDFEDYLLNSPMVKQIYAAKFKNSKYSGRWNILYEGDDSSENPKLYRCADFLD